MREKMLKFGFFLTLFKLHKIAKIWLFRLPQNKRRKPVWFRAGRFENAIHKELNVTDMHLIKKGFANKSYFVTNRKSDMHFNYNKFLLYGLNRIRIFLFYLKKKIGKLTHEWPFFPSLTIYHNSKLQQLSLKPPYYIKYELKLN